MLLQFTYIILTIWYVSLILDPYSVQEQEEFAKCDYECPDEKHHKFESTSVFPTKSFCELQLFHTLLNPKLKPQVIMDMYP